MPDAHSLARRARAGAPTDRQTDRPAGRTDRHRPRAPAMHGAHRHRHADMPPHTGYPHSITHSRVTRRSPLSSRRRSHTHVTPHSHCRYLTPTHTNQSITQHTHPARASLESYLAAPPSRARAGSSLHAFSRPLHAMLHAMLHAALGLQQRRPVFSRPLHASLGLQQRRMSSLSLSKVGFSRPLQASSSAAFSTPPAAPPSLRLSTPLYVASIRGKVHPRLMVLA